VQTTNIVTVAITAEITPLECHTLIIINIAIKEGLAVN
jgi:hypothetical protein